MLTALTCPLCGGQASHNILYPVKNRLQAVIRFDSIAECPACEFGFALPKPTQQVLNTFYASGAYWHESSGSRAQLAHERNQCHHRVMRCLPHFILGGAVADVGAGHGAIAEWLDSFCGNRTQRYDFVEPDSAGRELIHGKRVRFPINSVETIESLKHDYALIFLNHVLEHVADPIEFLSSVISHLRPGGVVYIESPNADQRFKDDVFPHTLFFTPKALSKLTSKIGLEVLECTAFGAHPGTLGGITPKQFHFAGAALHVAAKIGFTQITKLIDDFIWRYQPKSDGMWLRCLAQKPN